MLISIHTYFSNNWINLTQYLKCYCNVFYFFIFILYVSIWQIKLKHLYLEINQTSDSCSEGDMQQRTAESSPLWLGLSLHRWDTWGELPVYPSCVDFLFFFCNITILPWLQVSYSLIAKLERKKSHMVIADRHSQLSQTHCDICSHLWHLPVFRSWIHLLVACTHCVSLGLTQAQLNRQVILIQWYSSKQVGEDLDGWQLTLVLRSDFTLRSPWFDLMFWFLDFLQYCSWQDKLLVQIGGRADSPCDIWLY